MSSCTAMQAKFSEYLDGRMTGREMQRIAAHLDRCPGCAREWRALRQNQAALASLGPVPEPEDLVLRIRVAVSRERARREQERFCGACRLRGETRWVRFCCRPPQGLPVLCSFSAPSLCWWGCLPSPRARRPPRMCLWATPLRLDFVSRWAVRQRGRDRRKRWPGGGRGLYQQSRNGVRLSHCLRSRRRCNSGASRKYAGC